jgi:hypothetical protein
MAPSYWSKTPPGPYRLARVQTRLTIRAMMNSIPAWQEWLYLGLICPFLSDAEITGSLRP